MTRGCIARIVFLCIGLAASLQCDTDGDENHFHDWCGDGTCHPGEEVVCPADCHHWCTWGITCPAETSCHEPSRQCVTAEQLEVCVDEADGTQCAFEGSGAYDVCDGGACVGASTLETGSIGPITVNDTYVFWVRYNPRVARRYSIMRMPHAGGDSAEVYTAQTTSSVAAVTDLKASETYAYWQETNHIWRAPVSGGSLAALNEVECRNGESFALDSSHVYWWVTCGYGMGLYNQLRRASLGGGDDTVLMEIPGHISTTHKMEMNNSRILGNLGWGLIAFTLDGTLVAPNPEIPTDDFALGSDAVYLLADGEVQKVSLDFSDTETLATGQDTAARLDADDTHLYWTRSGTASSMDGSIMRVNPTVGGEPQVVAVNQAYPERIVVSKEHVYWVSVGAPDEPGDDSLMRKHKSP